MKFLQVRLLPVTLIAMLMVLGFRVSNLFDEQAPGLVALPQAQAAADADDERPADTGASNSKDDTDQSDDDGAAASHSYPADSLAGRDPTTFSSSEIALLENLARRRDEIEKRNSGLDVRENLLAATESRIDGKIDELKALEARIDMLVKKHDEAQEKRLARLVVVYEKMKPKDAARIFDDIELEILLDVSRRMKESKIAEIMAKMNPQRAQELTIALATRQDLAQQVTGE